MSTALQSVIVFFSALSFAAASVTTGFVIKNFFDAKKQTEAIEQNGKKVVALTAQVAKDHKDIMDKVDEETKAILESDQKILDELKRRTPPKGGKGAAPKKVNAPQNDDESVQNETEQEEKLVEVVIQGLKQYETRCENTRRKCDDVNRQANATLEEIERQNNNALEAIAAKIIDNLKAELEQKDDNEEA